MNKRGKLSIVVLGIIAVIAIVGMVLLFSKASTTGNFVVAGGTIQFTPQEACDQFGCPVAELRGGIHPASRGGIMAVCACPNGDVETPLTRPYDWRAEYYNQG